MFYGFTEIVVVVVALSLITFTVVVFVSTPAIQYPFHINGLRYAYYSPPVPFAPVITPAHTRTYTEH